MMLPPLEAARGRELVARLPGLRVLVVGDVMLDRFIVGKVTRISPEAPVPVVRFVRDFSRLGGAANVANNLAALGADVTLVGLVGADEAGQRLAAALESVKISSRGLVEDPGRPTVEKVRIVTDRHQQVARVDYEEEADIAAGVEARLIERLVNLGGDAKAVLLSDYMKGTITRSVVKALLSAKAGNSPLIVDPKVPNLQCYAGATLVTPNHHEAETATYRRIRTDEDARAAAIDFRGRAGCESVLITRGEHGMWLSSPGAEGAIPSQAREVSDVTGAGDTVVATLALALGAGATMAEAASLANHAAGIVVGKFGPATLTAIELMEAISA